LVEVQQAGRADLFAAESLSGEGWEQTPSNRFRHSESYLRSEANRAGLEFIDIEPDTKYIPADGGIRLGDKLLKRVELPRPAPSPDQFDGLIGQYGWDHDILYVFEKDRRLNVLIEWMEFDPLTQVADDVFNFPPRGLYDGEKAVFTRDVSGNATQVQVSGVVFKRCSIGGVSGGTFRIPPVKNFDDLRTQALTAKPPVETGEFRKPDLVELARLDPKIKLDIRYATTNNFFEYTGLFRGASIPAAARCRSAVTCSQKAHGNGLWPSDSRRLPSLVRHEDILGLYSR